MMKIIFWVVVLFGSCYSFWYAYYLIKDKNKLGAFGMALVGLLIGVFSFMVRLK
ncbi:hypothetical protein M3184_04015 [Metabacillus litoralis]|uniref:Uncharacterized protein n=2 Tax=Metabacillus TaxID=2675233 RepID=A0ABS7UYB5_9BACI|nr:hypothetical protein [Metabacillus rhizolycopersici]MBZ5753315.1 hypothetical protein [Metabacillus rhizolycopersici]MCM3651028.1 hypothetical protein [Metabacillus litoralis]